MANAFRELLDEPMGRHTVVSAAVTLLLIGILAAMMEPLPELGGEFLPLIAVSGFAALFAVTIVFGALTGILLLLAVGVLMFYHLAF